MAKKPANKGRTYPAEIPTRDEVGSVMKACSRKAPTGIRNRAIIVVMYRAGLRCLETLNLKLRDIDRDAGTIRIRRGKGGKARTVGIDPSAVAVIERWIDARANLGLNGGPVFSTLTGGELATSYIRKLLPRLARKAGVERRMHPHALRHAHAVELAREGIPVVIIMRQLGHASLATTTRYLAGLSPEETIQAIRKREWEAPN
ncbi:MAG: tyrosine-type recombinase/integrase [Planctomycetota bacterium]|nr:tyrosine-type recombinase/integrase [Planctomycetota bacterium]